jgi:hypothetical protein
VPSEEPLNGEMFHRAIMLSRQDELNKMLESPNGCRFLEIPDKLGNLPLMIAIIRNNIE